MAKTLPKREQAATADTWNLELMYANREAWEADLVLAQEMGKKLAAREGHICDSAEDLLDTLRQDTDLGRKMGHLGVYVSCLSDQDTSNDTHQEMEQRFSGISAGIYSSISFITPEILELDAPRLEEYYRQCPELEEYRIMLENILRLKPHILPKEMEKLLADASEICDNPDRTYSIFSNADLKFPEVEDENGEMVQITHGRFILLEESADRRVRRETFEKLYGVYKQYSRTLASIYSGQVKQLIFRARARHYDSTLEAAVNGVNVPSQVYHNLVETVNKNLDKMHRYVRLRKRLLGVDELHMYDIYTPIIAGVSKNIPFEEAKETVLKALAPLGEDYLKTVREGFENRWIDVYENEGKRSGAYSTGSYDSNPYILLNYTGNLDNVFTLIHEMGHSMHTWHSNHAQPPMYARYRIFVAEVASTCNEILLMEYLLSHTTDKKERAYLLNHYLGSFKGTVYRQTMFAEYEMITNRMAEGGQSLTAEALTKVYYDLNCKYYGPDMVSDPEIGVEWARIPHFYYNFYVYQYATSFSAAVAIARSILKEGAPAVERYKKFLSGGCSMPPVELLKIAGVDLTTAQPIQDALDVFGQVIAELEELTR
ncbi:MAG: oligoendopeptidase F [Butyrivibrio sp.]|nr:oligoendopeptidase F [Acetatifactor muris]MCM1558049.1 oligoendopeptidase F [Butyrivibrio sp.]